MAVDVEGRPICCEIWPGNTADVKTLLPVVKRMRERFRLREITVVADRGMVSQVTLQAFEKSDPPVRYIVGVRMRRQKEVSMSCSAAESRGLRVFQSAAKPRIQPRSKSRKSG
jgi:transposase